MIFCFGNGICDKIGDFEAAMMEAARAGAAKLPEAKHGAETRTRSAIS